MRGEEERRRRSDGLLRVPYKMLLAPVPPFPYGRQCGAAADRCPALHDLAQPRPGPSRGERGIEREFDEYYLQAEAALANMADLVAACRPRNRGRACRARRAKADRSDMSRQMRVSELPLPAGDPRREIREEVAPPR